MTRKNIQLRDHYFEVVQYASPQPYAPVPITSCLHFQGMYYVNLVGKGAFFKQGKELPAILRCQWINSG
jgi:hypothetical protein